MQNQSAREVDNQKMISIVQPRDNMQGKQDFIGSGRKLINTNTQANAFGSVQPQKQLPPRQDFEQFQEQQRLKRLKAEEARKNLEMDLLNKFRSNANKKPTLLSSNPLDTLKADERKLNQNQNYKSDHLCLEGESDEELLFADQIQTKPVQSVSEVGKSINQQKKTEVMLIDDGDELEILSEHLRDENEDRDNVSMASVQSTDKFDFNQRKSTGLLYGMTPNTIQKSFHDKYFKGSVQSFPAIKSLAKQNQFLKTAKSLSSHDIKPNLPTANPTSSIKKSSLCTTKAPKPVHYGGVGPFDFAKHVSQKDFEDAKHMIQQKHEKQLEKQNQKKREELSKLKLVKELQKRKRQMEEKKKQDEVIDDLFGSAKPTQEKQDKKQIADGLQALRDESSSDSSSSDNTPQQTATISADELPEATKIKQQERDEYFRQMHEQRQREALNEKLRKARYENRYNVDELVQPILNLDLINNYSAEGEFCPNNNQFPEVPNIFESTEQYFQIWLELFLYETYNQLINQRNESEKDREISKMYGMKSKHDNSQKNFEGYLQRSKQDHKFIYLKLSEKKDEAEKDGGDKKRYNFPHLSSLKEFDLLLLSKEELDVKNVKKLTSPQFLKDIQNQPGKMMAMVNQKRQQDKTFLELKVDICHDKYINLNVSEFDYYSMHVYYFDSMSTRIREFRTVKSAEFYPTAQFILNPQLIPKREPVKEGAVSLLANPMRPPSDRFASIMKSFVQTHAAMFNQSQHQALIDVSTMKPVDFMLIQGPPGTGKTHTIKGIISMLNHSLGKSKKILVCAPSNAAIDEIVTRLISKGGLFGQTEQLSIQKVLRIGSFDYEPSEIVKQVLFDTKYQESSNLMESQEELDKQQAQKQRWETDLKTVDKITALIKQKKSQHKENEIRSLVTQLLADKSQIDAYMLYDKEKRLKKVQNYKDLVKRNLAEQERAKNSPNKHLTKAQRKALEKKIVERTQIICTTLAMSTNEKLESLKPGDIEYLIVDEACQSVELNNLIPFEHCPQKVILVGDQQQLPATTFSENAEKTFYSRSMFERFLNCGIDKCMLEIQYRMDPIIRQFPSSQFYENRLRDDEFILKRDQEPEYKNGPIAQINAALSPIMFFDLAYSRENDSEKSKVNSDEVTFIEKLVMKLVTIIAQKFNQGFKHEGKSSDPSRYQKNNAMRQLKGCIGIISPYKSQVRLLKEKVFKLMRNGFEIDYPQDYVEINTVDAFQGREKDVIIFSCVRSNKDQGLGFVSDYRRMNVAITRAKHCLYVIGNQSTLNRDRNWRDLISFTKSKSSYREIKTKDDQLYVDRPIQRSVTISPKMEIKRPMPQRDQSDQCKEGLSGLAELLSSNPKSPKNSSENMKRKGSEEEEGQILSSGQLADKQATEADDVPEYTSKTERRDKEDAQFSDIQSSNYQSYNSNQVYCKQKWQQSKENRPDGSDLEKQSSESRQKHHYRNNYYKRKHPNDYHKDRREDNSYSNDWGNQRGDTWGNHPRNHNRGGERFHRSQSRHNQDQYRKRDQKAHYKNKSPERGNYRQDNRGNNNYHKRPKY